MHLRTVFTENLKFYRKESGLNQQQLAEKCDIATNYVSEIERGQKFPSVETIERLCSALRIPAYFLFIEEKTIVNNDPAVKMHIKKFGEKLMSEIVRVFSEYDIGT